MNWLAHLFLSEPDPAFRIGNLLPDLVPVHSLKGLSARFQVGIECHLQIDGFTDEQPVVRRSVRRFNPPYRRYAGILVDVFYDHFLARDWPALCSSSLPDYVADFYESIEPLRDQIPQVAYARLAQMREDNWLCTYGELDGIARALQRISSRLRRPIDFAGSVSILEDEYDSFRTDFADLFPQLRNHVNRSTRRS
jgi:acyl carrier protein phosphodiesterase